MGSRVSILSLRKLIVSSLGILGPTVLCGMGMVSAELYRDIVIAVVGTFSVGNAAEWFARRQKSGVLE